jgi:hypothetical protein
MGAGLQRAFAAARATQLRHPCAGRTKRQREVFELIAIDQEPRAAPATIKSLIDAGLIKRGADRVVGRDALGAIALETYFVPLAIHHQWCRWCSANVSDADLETA